jgi:hypothetical protein
MGKSTERRFDWRKPLVSAAGGILVSLLLTLCGNDIGVILYAAAVAFLGSVAVLLIVVFRKSQRDWVMALAVVAAFVIVTAGLLMNYDQLRPALRWALWSQRYKRQVLAQATTAQGQLKHFEWDVSGWGPTGPTVVYVVFDPADSLSAAAKSHTPGQFSGIPCEVPRVRQLERYWYAVTFYTEESWGVRNRLSCDEVPRG